MNTTKRLLSVLMCIAMLLSSLSSFGFALGNDTLAGATDSVETVVGDASTVGPNPTTNVAAPVIDRYTVVFDESVTEDTAETYDLSAKFVDKSGKTTFDYSDWEPIWNETIFNTYQAAVKAAVTSESGSGVMLMVSDVSNYGTINATGVKDVYIYTPYYNVMPYTIGGTAKDGSDWVLNQDFVENAPEFVGAGWNDFRCGVNFNIYGINMTGGYFNTAGSRSGKGIGLKASYTNVYYNGSQFIDNIIFAQSGNESQTTGQVGPGQDSDYILSGSAATFKNCWVKTTYKNQLFYEESPMTLTFDGVYWDEVQQTHGSKNWFKLGPQNTATPADEVTTFNIVNCNFQNTYLKILQQAKAKVNNSTKRVWNITNNVFKDSSLGNTPTGTGAYVNTNAVIGEFYSSGWTHLNVTNNVFVDTNNDAVLLGGNQNGSLVLTVKNNMFNGVTPVVNAAAAGITAGTGSVITNNFASATYAEDLTNVIGVSVTATGAAAVDPATNYDDYLDSAMTVLMSSISIENIEANGTGSIIFDKAGKSVTWLKTSGTAADLGITTADGVTYTWHTAKDAEAVNASTITADGTYYIKAAKGIYTMWYTVTIAAPQNMFSDVFVEKDGITKAALLVDSDSAAVAAGSIYEASWKGTNYNFIKGTNVFSTIAEAVGYAQANGIVNPQILVKKSSETHIKAAYPAKYYTENYDINPVVKGDTWSLNPNFVYGAGCASSNVFDGISVNADAPAGDYYFYGFSVDYDIANRTFNAANMYVINTYIKIGDAGAFSGPGGQAAGTIASSKAMNTKLEVKDAYFTYNNMSKQPRLLATGSLPTELIIDGAFFDVPVDAATGREFYPNNYSDRAVIAIKNSYFKNTRWGGSAVFEGDKAAMSAEQDRKFIIDNNVFDNAYLGGDAIVRAYGQCFSNFTFTNNVLKNIDKDIVIFNNVGANSDNKAMDLVIENNKIYGGSGKVAKTTGRTLSEASSIAKNYYAANEDAVCGANVFADDSLYGSSFYVDEEMTTLSTDLLLESATVNDDESIATLDNNALLITLTTTADTSVLDVVAKEGTELTWYEDAALEAETEITEVPWEPADFEEGQYLYGKVALADDDTKFLVYKLAVTSPSENLFTDVYGEQGEDTVNIDKDKAIIITNDEALVNANNNQIVELEWKGIAYDFIKGKNAFTSYAAYVASEEFGKIDTPHILYKQAVDTVKGEYKLHLQAPAHVFTQNYDANPVKKGVALDGSDWAFNEGTEKGQWNPAYVVETSSVGIPNINGGPDVPAGEYWFYGFTVRYHLEDHAKAAVDTKFINTHFLSKNWSALGSDGHSTGGNILLSFGNKGNTGTEEEPANAYQKVELKNIYVSLANGDVHPGLLFPGVMHEETILDSWFIDIPETSTTYKTGTSASFVGNKGSVVIKDSLFRNMLYNQFAFVGDDVVAGDDKTITVENNIFINSQFRNNYNGVICYKPNAYTGLTIKDNYFYKENGTEYLSSTGAGDVIEGAPFKLVITGNYINKKDGAWNAIKDRNYTEDSVIEGNYALIGDNAYGSYTYIQGDVKDENNKNTIYMYTNWWYLDAAMTARSDELQPGYTFNDAAFATEMAYEVGMKDSTVNLMDLIDTKGNYIRAYADETCETPIDVKKVNVPAGGTKVYLKVESADGALVDAYSSNVTAASEVDANVYAVTLTREAGNYLNNIAGGAKLDAPNFADRYWVTWRGEYTVTGAGAEAVDATKHRVGAIYYSNIVVEDTEHGTTNLDAIKAAITAAVTAPGATVSSIDAAVAEINADRQSTIDKVYVLADTESLIWNNETQTYGFYYNFNIPQNYYRGVILYSVYADDAGAVQVEFSNAVIQQAK